MSTGYMVVRGDYTTTNLPLELEVTATVGAEIAQQYDAGDGLPGPTGTGGHVGSPFRAILTLADASNRMLRGALQHGHRLLELSFTIPDDVAGPAFTGPAVHHLNVTRADVTAEVDQATIEANATLPAKWWQLP